MNSQSLETTLVNALNRLQHADFDKEFLREQDSLKAEVVVEQHFAFAIARYHFAVSAGSFCEVFVDIPIAPLPNSSPLLVGLCNVRSLLVPVYQLHTVLGSPLPGKALVFCVGRGDNTIGLLINELPVSLGLSQEDLAPENNSPEIDVLTQLSQGVYTSRSKLWHLLDGQSLGEQLLSLANSRTLQSPTYLADTRARSSRAI